MVSNWLEWESERLTKKLGHLVSVDDVREIMRSRNKKVNPENRPFAKDRGAAKRAANVRWDKYRKQGGSHEDH